MQVNNISNTNFKGSFFIKTATPELGQEIMQTFRQGRVIYNNIMSRGDMFVVARDSHDNKIKNLLNDKNIKFEFFPQINTYNGSYFIGHEHKIAALLEDLRLASG